jgi:hypothetical protein
MTNDVYDKIIEMCERTIKTIGTAKSQEELSYTMIGVLMGIMGVCGGAKAIEKKDENLPENTPVCEHKNMSKNKLFSSSYGHCTDCGEEAQCAP